MFMFPRSSANALTVSSTWMTIRNKANEALLRFLQSQLKPLTERPDFIEMIHVFKELVGKEPGDMLKDSVYMKAYLDKVNDESVEEIQSRIDEIQPIMDIIPEAASTLFDEVLKPIKMDNSIQAIPLIRIVGAVFLHIFTFESNKKALSEANEVTQCARALDGLPEALDGEVKSLLRHVRCQGDSLLGLGTKPQMLESYKDDVMKPWVENLMEVKIAPVVKNLGTALEAVSSAPEGGTDRWQLPELKFFSDEKLQLNMADLKRIRGMAAPMREVMRNFELMETSVNIAGQTLKQFGSNASIVHNNLIILEAKRLLGTCMFTQAMTKKLKSDQTRQGDLFLALAS